MWIGGVLGILFCLLVYKRQGETPRISPTCGPFKKGILTFYCAGTQRHIHHWMIAGPLIIVFAFISYDAMAFCIVLTIHGLHYRDRFNTIYIEVPTEDFTVVPPAIPPPSPQNNIFSEFYVNDKVYI